MAESAGDLEGTPVALAGLSLRELAGVDDLVFEEALGPLLQGLAEAGERLWSQGGRCQQVSQIIRPGKAA